MSSFEVKNNITLMVTVCFASFEAIGELQREKLCQSHAAVFRWNERTISTSKELSAFVTPHRAGQCIFHMEEVGQCNRADFMEISNSQKSWGN